MTKLLSRRFAHEGPVESARLLRIGRLGIAALGVMFLGSAGLWAQTPDATQACGTVFSDCGATPQQGITGDKAPSATEAGTDPGLSSQVRDRSNNPIYIDQANNSQSTSAQYPLRTAPVVFSEDPITDLQRLARSSSGQMLPIFGRDFFRDSPSTFAPGDQLAPPSGYVIGPGDVLLVRLWGPETFNSQLTVDRSGAIYIPKVGAVTVAGLRFDQLQKHVEDAASRVYRNFSVSVNLGQLRSVQVYVVGEARRPGAYTVSSLSTILNVLFVSGGPNVRGSMRQIKVLRNGTTLPDFDLYDVVLHGDKSRDVRIQEGDVLFIPPVGPQVALSGSVRHPAIYEVKKESVLKDVLDLAGGFSAIGVPETVSLDRIDDANIRQTLNIATDASGLMIALRDGDVIFAHHIFAGYTKTVSLRGNVANPGRFAWHPGMRLSEILPDRMALLTNAYWRERNRLGLPTPLFEPLSRAQTAELQEQARMGSRASDKGREQNYANLRDLDDTPNGSTDQRDPLPSTSAAQSSSFSRSTSETARSIGQVGPAVGGVVVGDSQVDNGVPESSSSDLLLQPAGARTPTNQIQIPAPEINWSYAVIERLDPDTLKSLLVPFNLGRLVQDHDPSQDLTLQPGDIVTILSQKDIPVSLDAQTKYVRLEGEFVSPGVYSSEPDETLADLVRRAGGFTPRAYLYGSTFLRESARVFQQQRLDEYVTQLSTNMERALAVRSVSSSTGISDPTSLTEQHDIVAQLRQLRATGRIVLTFLPESKGSDSIPKMQLENGDIFRVPAQPATINVIGAVHGQNVFLYKPSLKFSDYVSLAGSTNRIADKKDAYIIRADGSILSREQTKSVFSNRFESASIYPGDSIVIPEKLIQPTAIRTFLDYSQILSSFGLAAAAINVVR